MLTILDCESADLGENRFRPPPEIGKNGPKMDFGLTGNLKKNRPKIGEINQKLDRGYFRRFFLFLTRKTEPCGASSCNSLHRQDLEAGKVHEVTLVLT